MKFVIDGVFLTQNTTGIQRFAYEICSELDNLIEKDVLEILVPEDATFLPDYKNISIVKYGKLHGYLWQQIDFCYYLKKKKYQGICLTNEVPVLFPKGIVCLHDISYKVNPEFFNYGKGRLSVIWHKINYLAIVKSKMKILTVSEFSKKEIMRIYGIDEQRIDIIYNAWQHMNRISENEFVYDKYGFLKKNEYYFSMSTLAANKNFKWILYAAKQNPQYQFAIAGGGKLRGAAEAMGFTNLSNVHFLGYVSDEEAKTLMHNCKAFLFPTLYEGFGIPPLEAISCGCKQIIVSDIPCMHEIYGDYAQYINPIDYNSIVLPENNEYKKINNLLKKYSWKESAQRLFYVIKKEMKENIY